MMCRKTHSLQLQKIVPDYQGDNKSSTAVEIMKFYSYLTLKKLHLNTI